MGVGERVTIEGTLEGSVGDIEMSKSTAMIVSVAGLALLLVSALADYIGLGAGAVDFGNKQITASIVGALIFIAGLVMASRSKGPA